MTSNAILSSGAAFNVVFKASFKVQNTFGSQFQAYTTNIMGQPSLNRSVDDSLVYLSDNPIIGLSTITAILERPFLEEVMPEEFQAGPNYVSTSLVIHVDENLKIDKQILINRPFELYIGYATDAFSSYTLWVTGKMIGANKIAPNKLRLDLSTTGTKVQSLFPTTTFSDGRCSPYIFGRVDKITPVLRPDGRHQFHTGAVDIDAGTYKDYTPSISISSDDASYLGEVTYQLRLAGVPTTSTATDAPPSEITVTGDKIREVDGYIEVTIPDSTATPSNEFALVTIQPKFVGDFNVGVSDSAYFYDEWELQLDSASTVSSYSLKSDNFQVAATINIESSVIVRTPKELLATGTVALYKFKKLDADDAETVIVNVLSFRRVFVRNEYPQDIQGFDSGGARFPTVRVGDVANIDPAELNGISVYDDTGGVAYPEFMSGFVLDAVGTSASQNSVAACQSIATAAGITLTSSIVGDSMGVYMDTQKTSIQQIRDIAAPLDYIEKTNLTNENMTLERRYNAQPLDFDGNASSNNDFNITADQIIAGSIQYGTTKIGASRINVLIDYNHRTPADSDTVTDFNSLGVSTEVFTLPTPLRGEAAAAQLASLVGRQAVEREPYSMQIIGQGLGLRTNMVGVITHPDLRVGISHIKNVMQVGDNTEILVDNYV